MKKSFQAALMVAAVVMAGCSVGPRYKVPTVQTPPAYRETPPEAFKESKEWKTANPADMAIRAKWWEIFGDPQLNALEEQIEPANQDLKAAEARFREARAAVRFNRSGLYPTLNVGATSGAIRNSANRPGLPSTIGGSQTGNFLLPFDLSYEVDLWGRVRKTIEAAGNEAQASAADLQTVRLSLQSELALDYFEIRLADLQRRILNDTVVTFTEALRLTTNRYEGGVSPKSDVSQARTQLEAARAQATDVGVERARYEHAIATLIGQPAAQFSLAEVRDNPQAPVVPIGLPSQLLERRPDIAAFERRVAEANEQIGLAKIAYYPRLTLGASAGLQGTSLLNWFTWPSRVWSVGPNLFQTLFDGGRRRAVTESTLANYDALVANYRQTTLTAFQQVEDNIAALRLLETEAGQQAAAVDASSEFVDVATNRYKGGVDTYLQVLTAQTLKLSNQRNAADILRRRMAASVLLVKALGGGWNVSELPTVSSLH